MGKPYASEMQCLSATYDWATVTPLGALIQAARKAAALPLVAIGSGGSYTTATFAAAIHRIYGSTSATVMTPFEAVSTPLSLRQTSVFFATASGRNPDAIGAFEKLVRNEPKRFLILCTSEGSPVMRRAAKHPDVDFTEFELPLGKDGFLATNSLLASVVIIARAYAAAFGVAEPLPRSLPELLHAKWDQVADDIHERCQPLWERQYLSVLYGPSCQAAAVDLESKFTEAALGAVQLADFRNFAHGRHHWLAKRGSETAVLALVSDEDRRLADATIEFLPKEIPIVRLNAVGGSIQAGLSMLLQVFMVVSSAGQTRGIDPGKPGVPQFGRRIYHFRAFNSGNQPSDALPVDEAAAIERKTGASIATHRARATLERWQASYRDFRDRLTRARFHGVVFDYDGTLCHEANRFSPLEDVVGRQLNRLLRAGIVIGVATGRGKSVKKALRQAIQPRYWERVVVGYYNGGDIAFLTDDTRPDGAETTMPTLELIAKALVKVITPELAEIEFRPLQITIQPRPKAGADEIWNHVQHLVMTTGIKGIAAVRSGHSMDILAPDVSKQSVVDYIQKFIQVSPETPILCIGDRGLWPGNDYALLSTPYSLSVDEVSPDPKSCWNLAPPGHRGPTAALDYLKQLKSDGDGFRFTLE